MKKNFRNTRKEAIQRKEMVFALHNEGKKNKEIAFLVGVTRVRVYQILRELKQDPRRSWVKLSDLEAPKAETAKEFLPTLKELNGGKKLTYGLVWKHIHEGMKQKDIATMYGVDEATVSYRKKQKARSHKTNKKTAGSSKKPATFGSKEWVKTLHESTRHIKRIQVNPFQIERIVLDEVPSFGGKVYLARKINEIITYIKQMEKKS